MVTWNTARDGLFDYYRCEITTVEGKGPPFIILRRKKGRRISVLQPSGAGR